MGDYGELPVLGSYASAFSTNAVHLIADRVSLPERAGEVIATELMRPDDAAFYSDLSRCLRAPTSPEPEVVQQGANNREDEAKQSGGGGVPSQTTPLPRLPKPRVLATHQQYIALLQQMKKYGMLSYTQNPKCVVGMFGIEKPDGSQRLIIDGRAANRMFADPPHVELPGPDTFTRIVVPAVPIADGAQAPESAGPTRLPPVWVAKSDLSDFFYRFSIPE